MVLVARAKATATDAVRAKSANVEPNPRLRTKRPRRLIPNLGREP